MLEWNLLLYANSANGKWSSQFPWKLSTQTFNISSSVCIVRSVCSPNYGWNALLKFWLPKASCKAPQKWDVNLLSLSNTILIGTPCNFTFSSIYNLASRLKGKIFLIGKKWVDFRLLSPRLHLVLCVLGKPVTKSMEIWSHFYSGTGNGYSKPIGF